MIKSTKVILLSGLLLVFGTTEMRGQTPEVIPPTDDNSTELKKGAPKEDPTRPQAPDRQMIFCQYDGEELTFSFAYSEGECEVQLTDRTGLSQFYTIDSSELFASVYVGKIGYTEITLTTERGVTYTGVINRAQ